VSKDKVVMVWGCVVSCFRHLERLFEELEDYRAFELLRSHAVRADYLLTKQASPVRSDRARLQPGTLQS
jgi:hypothetical protein